MWVAEVGSAEEPLYSNQPKRVDTDPMNLPEVPCITFVLITACMCVMFWLLWPDLKRIVRGLNSTPSKLAHGSLRIDNSAGMNERFNE